MSTSSLRSRWRHAASVAALAVVAALTLAGCPQSSNSGLNTEATSAPVPTIDKAKDEKSAKAALLQTDDLPDDGWTTGTTAKASRTNSGSSFDCPELGPTFNEGGDVPNQAKASAPASERERPFGRVSDEVIFFADENTAKAEVEAIKKKTDLLKKCFERGFSHDFAREGRTSETIVEDWDLGKMGSSHVAFDISVSVETEGTTVEVHVGLAIVRVGRAATIVVIGQLDPVGDDAKDIVQRATDKLTDAQG